MIRLLPIPVAGALAALVVILLAHPPREGAGGAPESPPFYLVPGDNQVTVTSQPTVSETEGDPFFGLASVVASPLYDAGFRKVDVEGYRIWRGRAQWSREGVGVRDNEPGGSPRLSPEVLRPCHSATAIAQAAITPRGLSHNGW